VAKKRSEQKVWVDEKLALLNHPVPTRSGRHQGDQMGQILAQRPMGNFGQFFENYAITYSQMLCVFFHAKCISF
jgi:hypothetical protein